MPNPCPAATRPPITVPPASVASPTPADRRREIAHLLAIAYWRLQMAATDRTDADDTPTRSLDGQAGPER
jgi:hypothetical protein